MDTEKNSNPGIEEVLQGDAQDTGSDTFFDSLEQQVNGQIHDDESTQPDTEQVTQQQTPASTGNENIDWKSEAETLKERYAGSSREAQRLKAELNGVQELTKFRPLIEHLRNDPTSVEVLRNHISGQSDLTTQFGEDFVFDAQEAVTDPKSDSAKALKQMINSEADKKVNQKLQAQQQQNQVAVAEMKKQRQIQDFVKRTGMNETQLQEMQTWASQRELTMDDIYYLMNKEQAATNVANNTKQEMLNQMKAVRNIPMSASNANSAPDSKSPDDAVFDILKGMDEGAENLFG
tara:strand:+ start:794 stop:1666 length:873 start_codon:yes stop_codon:yes gene_type:complete